MTHRWDETWHRLLQWTNGQGRSERLAAQILLSEGYTSLDPSHPLGGPDGGKDALCLKDGKKWVMAVFFPRGHQSPGAIRSKLLIDLRGVASNAADGLVFVTNQELTLGDRDALMEAASADAAVELYHLERVTAILDAPAMAAVRKQFLEIDIAAPPQAVPQNFTQELLGPDFEPNIYVLQKADDTPDGNRPAYEFFRVRVYSEALRRGPFEPDEEDAFRDLIRERFIEDSNAQLEAASDDRVLVEDRADDLRFHRRWGWWTMGALGIAATLRDLYRDGMYSVADIVMDVSRFLVLVGELGRELGGACDARVLFGMDPGHLRPDFDPSDRIAREHLGARLAGVRSVARPTLERSRETAVDGICPLSDLATQAVRLAAEGTALSLRKLHGARISTEEFAASIPAVVEACKRARVL